MYRTVQIAVTGLLGLYWAIVAFTNMLDYGTNYQFVEKVLSMEDTFHTQMWRSITWAPAAHVCYVAIILWETLCAGICLWGAAQMFKTRQHAGAEYEKAKERGLLGLLLGFVLWTGIFLCGGGEWFLMWQSEKWNGQDVAAKMAILYATGLLILK